MMDDRNSFGEGLFAERPALAGSDREETTRRRHSLPRAIVAPLHYEPNYQYPVLVWLHGTVGGDENELLEVMPQLDLRNYVAIAPRGLPRSSGGEQVWDWPQTPEGIYEAEARVFDLIETAAKRFCVAREKIFLLGHGSGGTMALRLAWRWPERFAGVVSLGGPIPRGGRPLARFQAARRVPILLVTTGESPTYTPTVAAEDLKCLHMAGMNVVLRQYPGRNEINPLVLADVNRWLMEVVLGL